jgi:hypothetical protein
VNEDDCSFLFDLADAGTFLLLCIRQKKSQEKRHKKWVTENQSIYPLLMDVKEKLWRCKRCLFAAKCFLGARHHKGRLNFTDVG